MSERVRTSIEGDKFKIKASAGDCYSIVFVDSGYECRARKHLVERGEVYDPTPLIEDMNSWEEYEEYFTNNAGQTFRAFAKKGNKVRIEFPNTGYVGEVYLYNARKGKVRDPYEVSLYGVGKIGDIDKEKPYWKQARQLWSNMIKRCYDPNYEEGYFGDSEVHERWHTFENFLADIPKLEGFAGWVKGHTGGLKYNLDKDFYKRGNKVYSKHLCRFLPDSFNKAMGKKEFKE